MYLITLPSEEALGRLHRHHISDVQGYKIADQRPK